MEDSGLNKRYNS